MKLVDLTNLPLYLLLRPVLCHGCFRVLHLGHVRHFEAAKRLGGPLVVTVTPDRFVNKSPGSPFSEQERAEMVASLSVVDFVAINQWPTAVETIRLLRPAAFVKGSDTEWSPAFAEECKAVEEVGGLVYYTSEREWHSSDMLADLLAKQREPV